MARKDDFKIQPQCLADFLGWTLVALPDSRLLLEIDMAPPESVRVERRQLLLSRVAAHRLGQALAEGAFSLFLPPPTEESEKARSAA